MNQPRVTDYFKTPPPIRKQYSSSRKRKAGDDVTPRPSSKKGKFKENAVPQQDEDDLFAQDELRPRRSDGGRKSAPGLASLDSTLVGTAALTSRRDARVLETPATGPRVKPRRTRSDSRRTPSNAGAHGERRDGGPSTLDAIPSKRGGRDALPSPPPTDLFLRKRTSPSFKRSRIGRGSSDPPSDNNIPQPFIEGGMYYATPRTPQRKAKRLHRSPFDGSSPLTSPPNTPLRRNGAIFLPASPSRRYNTQQASSEHHETGAMTCEDIIPSSQSLPFLTHGMFVGSVPPSPKKSSLYEESPFVVPRAPPLLAQETMPRFGDAETFPDGASGLVAPLRTHSTIVGSSQTQELQIPSLYARRDNNARSTIGRSSRNDTDFHNHGAVGAPPRACSPNSEVCQVPDALRTSSDIATGGKMGGSGSSRAHDDPFSPVGNSPRGEAAARGSPTTNSSRSSMSSSMDLVPTSQSRYEKDLSIPRFASPKKTVTPDSESSNSVRSSHSRIGRVDFSQFMLSQQPTSPGYVTAIGDVSIGPEAPQAISTESVESLDLFSPPPSPRNEAICPMSGSSPRAEGSAGMPLPGNRMGAPLLGTRSSTRAPVMIHSAGRKSVGVPRMESDSETEPESDELPIHPPASRNSRSPKRLGTFIATLLGARRKSQRQRSQQKTDDEDSVTESESDEPLPGVTPRLHRSLRDEPRLRQVETPGTILLQGEVDVPMRSYEDSVTEPESDDLPTTMGRIVPLASRPRSRSPARRIETMSQGTAGVSTDAVEISQSHSEDADDAHSLISDTALSIPSQSTSSSGGSYDWNGSESSSLPSAVVDFLSAFDDDDDNDNVVGG